MNDDDLLAAVPDSFSDVHMRAPVEQIVNRGPAVRARRRIPGVAGALAVTAGAALAIAVPLAVHQPGSRPGYPGGVQLAAWTVTRAGNGDITVRIRELRDPAGLQRKLRADGVPASVTFSGRLNPACRPYPGGTPRDGRPVPPLLKRVFPDSYRTGPPPSTPFLLIHPAALPHQAGVRLAAGFSPSQQSIIADSLHLPEILDTEG
jgi:hypothetical protein